MATTYSTQLTNDRATPPVINGGYGSRLTSIQWDYTVAGAALVATDIVQLCKVPAGCKVMVPLSWIHVSATTGASTTIDIGHAAYKDKNGATIAAVADALVNGFDSTVIVPTLYTPMGTSVVGGIMDFTDAVESVIITATCLDSGGTFDGTIGDIWYGSFVTIVGGN